MKFKKCIASLLITVSLSSVFFSSAVSVKVLADDVKSPQVVDYNNQEQKQIDDVANIFKQMFENGITEKNFSEYVYNNFSRKDISDVENELEASINDPYERVPWNQMGKCMVGKIRDEFFATINVAVIVRYAQKKLGKN